MTVKNIYPTGHGMDIEVFTPTLGQTVFPLTQKGPFTYAGALINGFQLRRMSNTFTFTDVDGGQDPAKNWKMVWDNKVLAYCPASYGQQLDFDTEDGRAELFLKSDANMAHINLYKNGGTFGNDVHFDVSEDGKYIVPTWPQGFQWWKYTWTIDYQAVLQVTDKVRVQMYFAPKTWTATAGQTVFTDSTNPYLSKNRLVASVFVDGIQLTTGYTIHASNNTLTINAGVALGLEVYVSFSDKDTFEKVNLTSTYLDEIICHDKNLANVSKPWIRARYRGEENVYFVFPTQTLPFYVTEASEIPGDYYYLNSSMTSGVKLTGIMSGDTPLTSFRMFATQEEWDEHLTAGVEDNAGLLISGSKKSTITGIEFKYDTFPLESFTPADIIHCAADHVTQGLTVVPDNRWTFPNLEVGVLPTDSDPRVISHVTSCRFSNIVATSIFGGGSGIEITDCNVDDCPDKEEFGVALAWLVDVNFFDDREILQNTIVAFNKAEACTVDGTDIPEQWAAVNVAQAQNGGVAYKNVVTGCSISNLSAVAAIEGSFVYAGYGPSKSYDNEVSDNTITKCSAGVMVDGSIDTGAQVETTKVTDNNIVDQDEAPANSFWAEVLGSTTGRGPGVFMQMCRSSSVNGNHYKFSGLLPDQPSAESAIWLDYCNRCSVYENKRDFPSNLTIEHWTADTNGYGNTINNVKKVTGRERPTGIAQAVQSKMKQKKDEMRVKHKAFEYSHLRNHNKKQPVA